MNVYTAADNARQELTELLEKKAALQKALETTVKVAVGQMGLTCNEDALDYLEDMMTDLFFEEQTRLEEAVEEAEQALPSDLEEHGLTLWHVL